MALPFPPKKDDKSSRKNSESNNIKIITDEPLTAAPDLNKYSKTLSNIIINSQPRFTVGICGGWGTEKTTLMKMIRTKLDDNENIVTVWFDAWRYQDKKSILRAITLSLYKSGKSKKGKWKAFKRGIEDFASATSINLGILNFNLGQMRSLRRNDDEFYLELGDQLEFELIKIRETDPSCRIIVFVNDLHKCDPEKALELLESIRGFLAINGIIYVLGVDPTTIDSLLELKYGKDHKIDRIKYLQSIVQLSYTIPSLWNLPRFSDTIRNMMEGSHLPNDVIAKVLETKIEELIIRIVGLNPRDIKRFINLIVISHEIYGYEVNDIEKIIVIQAFYFHGDKWIEFLKLLIPYRQRIAFLTHFILWLEKESRNISNLYDLKNILANNKNLEKDDYIYKSLADKSLLDIYKKLIDIDDNELFTFLSVSKEALLIIDKIERYLMVSDK